MDGLDFVRARWFHDMLVEADSEASIVDLISSKSSNFKFLNNYLEMLVRRRMYRSFSDLDYNIIEYLLLHEAEPMINYRKGNRSETILDLVMKTKDERLLRQFVSFLKYVELPDSHSAKINNLEYSHCTNTKVLAAVAYQSIDLVRFTLEGHFYQGHFYQNEKSFYWRNTPLHIAASLPNLEITRYLLEHPVFGNIEAKNSNRETPLFLAVKHGQLEQVMVLHYYGANFEETDNRTNSVLHVSCSQEHINYKLFRFLLDIGMDLNSTEICFRTPLNILAKNHHAQNALKCAKLLIDRGADVNQLNIYKDTVLHTLMFYAGYSDHVLDFLYLFLKSGVDAEALDEQNRTFVDVLLSHSSIIVQQWILKYLILLDVEGIFQLGHLIPDIPYVQKCRNELERLNLFTMREYKIEPRFFKCSTVLLSNRKRVGEFCANVNLRTILYLLDEREYPIYGRDLINRYRSGLKLFVNSGDFGCIGFDEAGMLEFGYLVEILKFIPPQEFGKLKSTIRVDDCIRYMNLSSKLKAAKQKKEMRAKEKTEDNKQ
ncbi:uncharacterized protein LOC123682550 [Harmonia axyridis]|uniref:uncharacterized protein LOC123682550 n=1 Tax=Harmonia axyridis TaxID=115357 RepID=UPI001E275CB2|nr:uncharacterized protein LOC123682550 [Harmonia axyridis]